MRQVLIPLVLAFAGGCRHDPDCMAFEEVGEEVDEQGLSVDGPADQGDSPDEASSSQGGEGEELSPQDTGDHEDPGSGDTAGDDTGGVDTGGWGGPS